MSQVPKVESELAVFIKALDKPIKDLENKLKSLGLLPLNTESSSSAFFLSSFISELPAKCIVERRKDILSRGRDIILADYHNTMLAAGDAQEDDPSSAGDIGDAKAMMEQSGSFTMQALRFDCCQVSLASCRILKLVHEVLRQACSSSPDIAGVLYHCARDCLELFLAIVPIKFKHIIATVPRMGAVFFNDCTYIAHNCTLISHMYRQDLGAANPALFETTGFIDFIPRFRVIGDDVLTAHLEEQKQTLDLLVQRININTLGDDEDTAARPTDSIINAEEGATLILKHMQKLTGQWHDVLQEPVFERLEGYLVESTLRTCMKPLLEVRCIPDKQHTHVSNIVCSQNAFQRVLALILAESLRPYPNSGSRSQTHPTSQCRDWYAHGASLLP
jgi:hypothetical protein